MMAYWTMRSLQALGRVLPTRIVARASSLVGTLVYLALPRKRANMQHNLRVVLGIASPLSPRRERRIRLLARRSMVAYAQSVADFFRLPKLLPRVYRDTAATPGWEHLDAALATGRGMVFATAHFGHWDLAGAALARHCPDDTVYAVAEPFADARIDRLVSVRRAAYGLKAVPMHDVRQMVRVLRAGKVLGMLVDRPVGDEEGVTVQFFGHPTRIPSGAATLALLARCPIVPGYLRLRADGRFEGMILPPIEPVRTGDRTADIQATMQAVIGALEQIIRRSPHQWYMFRDMWPGVGRPQPAGLRMGMRRLAPPARLRLLFAAVRRD